MGEITTTPFTAIYDSDNNKYSIYVHINKINKKIYIGQTCRKPEYRWGKEGKNYFNQYFGKAIIKYGWDNFDHIILFHNLSLEEANIIEKELIKKYDSTNPSRGYNREEGGHSSLFSEETKKNISILRKNFWDSESGFQKREEFRQNMITFYQTEEGQKMKEFQKQRMSGENNPMYGKHHTEEVKKAQSARMMGEKNCNYNKTGFNNHLSKPVFCEELNKIFGSGQEASRETGIDASSIAKCCKGKAKTAGKMHWKYYYEEVRKNEE